MNVHVATLWFCWCVVLGAADGRVRLEIAGEGWDRPALTDVALAGMVP